MKLLSKLFGTLVITGATLLTTSILASGANATPTTITDNYIGGQPYPASWFGRDYIGAKDYFDVQKLVVDVVGGNLEVKVYSTFFNNVGIYDIGLGDLFISTNGYVAPADSTLDTFYNSPNNFNYALTTQHNGVGLGSAGTSTLFANSDTTTGLSYVSEGHPFRQFQGVQYVGEGEGLGFGGWSIADVAGSEYDVLTYTIALSSLGLSSNTAFNLGFHWTMTCANDVIEGGYQYNPIPEPTSMALLGLAGLVAAKRRKRA